MNLKSLLLSGAVLIAAQANAQNWVQDTVVMGAGYAQDVYYGLENGTKTPVSNINWDLAFSAIPASAMQSTVHYGVGAWINGSQYATSGGFPVSLYTLDMSAAAHFLTLTSADTVGKLTNPLINSVETYAAGAFNANATNPPFDFGWGTYDQASHNVDGDNIYLAIRNDVAYKIWIKSYTSLPPTVWKMYIGKLDGSSAIDTVELNITNDYNNRVFAYYSFDNGALDREPNVNDWDINFTRYTDLISMGGPLTPYGSTGVFSNPYVQVAQVNDLNADSVDYQDYLGDFETDINIIGRDWKTTTLVGNPPTNYKLDTVTYFIMPADSNIYQLEFTYASLASSGTIAFRKRLVYENVDTTTSVGALPEVISSMSLVPNPAANNTSIVVNSKEAGDAYIFVSDLTGKTVARYPISMKNGLNAFRISTENMPTGMYIVNMTNGSWKATQKLMVQH